MRLLALLPLAFALGASPSIAGPLHDAARAGDAALMQQLLRDSADINAQDENGETALFAAALAAQYSTHDQLLVAGADASIRNNQGLTGLHAAAMSGNANLVNSLIGGDYHSKRIELDDHDNELGVTPLYVAAEANHANIVAYLFSFGADAEIPDKAGLTALTRAGQNGYDEVATLLLRIGSACQEVDPAWKAECDKRKAALKK